MSLFAAVGDGGGRVFAGLHQSQFVRDHLPSLSIRWILSWRELVQSFEPTPLAPLRSWLANHGEDGLDSGPSIRPPAAPSAWSLGLPCVVAAAECLYR